jgi:hypothetical protein
LAPPAEIVIGVGGVADRALEGFVGGRQPAGDTPNERSTDDRAVAQEAVAADRNSTSVRNSLVGLVGL